MSQPVSPVAQRIRAYRQRQSAAGVQQLTVHLPSDAVAMLDALKAERRLSSRSQALLTLIEEGRLAARQTA